MFVLISGCWNDCGGKTVNGTAKFACRESLPFQISHGKDQNILNGFKSFTSTIHTLSSVVKHQPHFLFPLWSHTGLKVLMLRKVVWKNWNSCWKINVSSL